MAGNPKADLFVPASLSLADVFTSGDVIFQIPDYQRPYSWVDDQVEQLWEDLLEAYENNKEDETLDSNYFLGSLIVVKKGKMEDVVDGQQRLTTLMILLCTIRQTYPKINKLVDVNEFPDVVKMGKIKSCIADTNELTRLRLQTDVSQSSNVQELIFDEDIDFSTYEKPSKKQIESDAKYRYKNTAVICYNHIKELGEEKTGKFINYLMNQIKMIKITCFEESFAIKLFQVLNDRGMDLSAADIIKGYLLSGLVNDNHGREVFMHDWRMCEEWVKELDDSLTDLFTYYEYYLLGSNPKKSLVDELKILFKGKDSNTVLRDFKKFAEEYKAIYNSADKLISSFWYLPWGTYWATMLITIEHVDYKEKEELRLALRNFFYLNFIAGITLTSLKQTLFNIIVGIKNKESFKNLKALMDEKLKNLNIKDIVLSKLEGEVYFEGWLKAVLAVVEYYQTDEDEVAFISLDYKSLNVEHVYPQKPEEDSPWVTMFPEGPEYLNTLGNLTLLSGTKNRSAQNFPFKDKIFIYQGLDRKGNKTATKQGQTTVYQISQKIVNDYKAGLYKKQWNEESVNDRFNWLCSNIGEIFDIDVSSILKK
jgi:uncharacterized protein with ParB-like and HNH nuclease domain